MNRFQSMMGKFTWTAVLILAVSCSTSTPQSRRAERAAAYDALPPEIQRLVDEGQIKVGMPQDAVYIAWGRPSEVLEAESGDVGKLTTWLYYGTWMQETRYWNYAEIRDGDDVYLRRYLDREYNPRDYVRAEIVFSDGKVASWRTLPRPLDGRTGY